MTIDELKMLVDYYARKEARIRRRLSDEGDPIKKYQMLRCLYTKSAKICRLLRAGYFEVEQIFAQDGEGFVPPRKTELRIPLDLVPHNDMIKYQNDPFGLEHSDADGDWITVNGTHILLGEGGAVTGGPPNLKGKTFSGARSEKRPTRNKSSYKRPEPPTKEQIAESNAKLKERFIRDQQFLLGGKRYTLSEVKSCGKDSVKAKLAKTLGAKKDEIAVAKENGTLDELIDKYTDKAATKAVKNAERSLSWRLNYEKQYGSYENNRWKNEEDEKKALEKFGSTVLTNKEYSELLDKQLSVLTPDENTISHAYVCAGGDFGLESKSMNRKVYTQSGELNQTEKDFMQLVGDKAITLPRDVCLYRGSGIDYVERITGVSSQDDSFYEELEKKIGTTVTHSAVTSTAPGVPGHFNMGTAVVCQIKAHDGSKVYVPYNADEGELLLPPGQQLKITGYRRGDDYPGWSEDKKGITVGNFGERLILELEVIDDE